MTVGFIAFRSDFSFLFSFLGGRLDLRTNVTLSSLLVGHASRTLCMLHTACATVSLHVGIIRPRLSLLRRCACGTESNRTSLATTWLLSSVCSLTFDHLLSRMGSQRALVIQLSQATMVTSLIHVSISYLLFALSTRYYPSSVGCTCFFVCRSWALTVEPYVKCWIWTARCRPE